MEWVGKLSFLNQLYLALLTADLLLALANYARLSVYIKPLLVLIVSNLLVEISSDYIKVTTNGNNLFLYHLYAPIEYTCLAMFFSRIFPARQRRLVIGSVWLYLLFVGISSYYWQPFEHNNSITYMGESVLVIGWCYSFLRLVLQREDDYRPERDTTFWVVVGLLVYFAGTFFTIGLIDYFIIKNRTLASVIYYASFPFCYILYLIIGLVIAKPQFVKEYTW